MPFRGYYPRLTESLPRPPRARRDRFGTTAANAVVPVDTSTPGSSYGWQGVNQKAYQHVGGIATIQMGARLLMVDPPIISPTPATTGQVPNSNVAGPDVVKAQWHTASEVLGTVSFVAGLAATVLACTGVGLPIALALNGISLGAQIASTVIDCYQQSGGGDCSAQIITGVAGFGFGRVVSGSLKYFGVAEKEAKRQELISGGIFGGLTGGVWMLQPSTTP